MSRVGRERIVLLALVAAVAGFVIWSSQRDADALAGGATKRTSEGAHAPLVDPASAPAAARTPETIKREAAGSDATAAQNENDPGSAKPTAPPRDFYVHVFNESGGGPIAGATLLVSRFEPAVFANTTTDWSEVPALRTHDGSEPATARAKQTVRTGEDGRAVFPVATDRWPVVDVLAKNCVPVYFCAGGDRGTRERPLEIGLTLTASLLGIVRDVKRRPVAGLPISVRFARASLQRPRPAFGSMFDAGMAECVATTDVEGAFAFLGLPPDVELFFDATTNEKYWLGPQWLWLDPGEERHIEWTLQTGARVHGHVVGADGNPVAKATVVAGCAGKPLLEHDETDDQGSFTLEGLPSGSLALRADPHDDRYASRSIALELGIDAERSDVVIRLPAAAPLVVRALDPEGNECAPAEVHVFSSTNQQLGRNSNDLDDTAERATRGEAATCSLPGVPLGDLAIRVVPPLTSPWAAIETTFRHDGEHECFVQFGAGGRLAGTIVDAGDPLTRVAATATIRRRDAASAFATTLSMQSMIDPGTFGFDGVGASVWDVLARTDDGRIGVTSGLLLHSGEQLGSIVVEVARGATLELVVPDSVTSPESLLQAGPAIRFEARRGDAWVGAAFATPHGHTSLTVPPGRVTLDVILGGQVWLSRDVVVNAGEFLRVRF